MQVLDNSPSAGFISWANVSISYKGQVYDIADGNTDFIYVYWKYSDPTTFYGSDIYPTLGDDDLIVFLNKNGIHLTVPNTTILDGSLIVPESILTNAIAANVITTEKLASNAITADKIAANAIGANAIAANAVIAEKLAANAVTADKINVTDLAAISANLGTVTAGSLTSNTTIDVGTDVSIGSQLYISPGGPKGGGAINFKDSDGTTAADISLDYMTDHLYISTKPGSFVSASDIEARNALHAYELKSTKDPAGFCGVGGTSASTTTTSVAGVGVGFNMTAPVVPSSITLNETSSNTTPNVTDISLYGFWLYVNGNGNSGVYRYWRGTYNNPGGVG